MISIIYLLVKIEGFFLNWFMLRFFDLENNFSDYIHHINLPANLHVSYKKWLRYYLDFCHKYHHDRNNQSLLAPLFQKLKQKEQNKQQCENYHDIYPCCPVEAERSSKSARFAVKDFSCFSSKIIRNDCDGVDFPGKCQVWISQPGDDTFGGGQVIRWFLPSFHFFCKLRTVNCYLDNPLTPAPKAGFQPFLRGGLDLLYF